MNNLNLEYLIEMAGTVAFAVTAVLGLISMNITLFDAVIFAIITAVGGGTIRDVCLDVPVFWFNDLNYIWVAFYSGLIAYFARSYFTRKQVYNLMLYLDGLGAVLFGINATGKVWHLNIGLPVAPIIFGLITAVGGGLIRDVLAQRKTLMMKREFYSLPILLGAIFFVLVLKYFPQYETIGSLIAILFSFSFRAIAIKYNLSYPEWLITKVKK